MVSALTAVRDFLTGRSYALPNNIDSSHVYFGVPNDEWTPAEYGSYVATSNAVYTCVKRRADAISMLPIKLYQGEREVTGGPIRQLLDKPNPFWTGDRLKHMTSQSLSLWGEAYWFLERGIAGRATPREIWWGRPDRVKVYLDPQNYVSHFGYEPDNGGAEMRFETTEVVWLRYPNPVDEWSGLSPLAAARLAADTMSSAMKANRNLFSQGIQMGGFISPKAGQPMLTDEQGKALQDQFNRKFKGVENAHRWAVLKLDMQFQSLQMSPKDAEFVALHRMTLEDICRAFGVPLDLIGGERTYANAAEARHAFYADTIMPDARFIEAEITEQLLPMFGAQSTRAVFDMSGVEALQENEDSRQTRIRENWKAGLLTFNQAAELLGVDTIGDAGDVLAIPAGLTIIKPADLPAKADMTMTPPPDPMAQQDGTNPDAAQDAQNGSGQEQPRAMTRTTRAVAYGSDEHRRLWEARVNRTDRHEATVRRVVEDLMRNQRKSVLAKLTGRTARAVDPLELSENPFDKAEWVKKFRASLRPVLTQVVMDVGEAALAELAIGVSFNVKDPNVVRFLDQRAQRFAVQVNETTWTQLKDSLAQGIDAGEGIDELAKRVEQVMGNRIRSSAEVISRTEVIGASNGGTQLSWEQSGVVKGKTWLAALDDRTRETHIAAHNQTVPLDSDFQVGDGYGPHPGAIGLAEEDIACRCSMTAVIDVDWTD